MFEYKVGYDREVRGLLVFLAACGRLHFGTVGDAAASDEGGGGDGCTVTPAATLQTGELQIAASATSALAPVTVALESSILFTSIREAEPSPAYGDTMCQLDASGVFCQRLTAGTDYAMSTGVITVRWTIATFPSGVAVQRGIADMTATTPVTVAVSPFDTTSSFLVMNGSWMNTGNSWGTDEFVRGRVVDTQTLEFAAVANASVVSWQLVAMAGAQVQFGVGNFATADTAVDVAIAPIDAAHAFPLVSYTEDSTVGLGATMSMVSATFGSPAMLHLARTGSGAPLAAAWQVITVPFPVAHGHASFPPGVLSATVPAPPHPDTTVAFGTGMSVLGTSGGQTDLPTSDPQSDMVGEATATFDVQPSGMTIARATALSSMDLWWVEVDFSTCR